MVDINLLQFAEVNIRYKFSEMFGYSKKWSRFAESPAKHRDSDRSRAEQRMPEGTHGIMRL